MPHPVVTSLTEGEKPSPVQTITQIVQVHSRWERAETQACDPKLPIQAFICHISPYIIQKWKWIFHLRFLLFSFFLHCPKSRHSGPKLHFELIAKMINLKMGDLQGKKAQYFGEITATELELNSTSTSFHGGGYSCEKHMYMSTASNLPLLWGLSSTAPWTG